MVQVTRFRTWPLVGLAALVGGCVTTGLNNPNLASFEAPEAHDGGIEIARTTLVPGAGASPKAVQDCYGPGMGVVVEGTMGSHKTLFDAQGEPCTEAQVLFDGASATGKRQADPAIQIRLHDALGALLDERTDVPNGQNRRALKAGPLAAVPTIKVDERLLGDVPSPAGPDPLLKTLETWRRTDATLTERGAQADEASNRELSRLVRQAENASSSEAAATLAAQLRERERGLEEERRRHAETLSVSAKSRAQTQAARDAWQQEQNRLQDELEAAKARATQFEELAGRLKSDQTRKEAAYADRISTLSGHLRIAEAQADTSRRQLILQAAAKIAEAQALAQAAQTEAQSTQLAEASRLQAQANELMDKVLIARGAETDIEPAAGPSKTDLPLDQAPVVLQAKERTLPEILTEVLQQAVPHSGAWRADWQVTGPEAKLLQEKWSLTAEATVGQILADLQKQVQAAHGVKLTFTPFTQTKVVVITAVK